MAILPLDGVTVVTVEQAVATPLATRHLADLGARVIKVERPEGGDFAREYDHAVEGTGAHFVWLNRGKESLAIDLKATEGRDAVRAPLDRADVFLQNLAPGAAERLGLDATSCAPHHPELIVVNLSGYGIGGPLEQRKAYDMLVQAESGLIAITGTPETAVKTGIPTADIAVRHVLRAGGAGRAAAALAHRARARRSTCRCSRRRSSGWATRSTRRSTRAASPRGWA